ncbi:MAG TPA: polyprenol monophosphomannose synthase [bacterium]|nr:polyprenol monophosphomannose synthase [bacterium]
MKPLIVVPTYNEKDNISRLIEELLALDSPLHVLVVDDNSPDGTGEIVEVLGQKSPRVHLLKRPQKNGIGPAYIAGFTWALERGYDVMMEMDADFSHQPQYVPEFLDKILSNDVVIGSRWVKGGGIADWSFGRVALSYLANLYSRFILWIPVLDLTGGFTCWRRSVLEAIGLDKVHSDGYCFQIEMKYRAFKKKFKMAEIPIQFPDRVAGKSKISRKIVYEALGMVWYLRMTV